jgi:hypothetical protein
MKRTVCAVGVMLTIFLWAGMPGVGAQGEPVTDPTGTPITGAALNATRDIGGDALGPVGHADGPAPAGGGGSADSSGSVEDGAASGPAVPLGAPASTAGWLAWTLAAGAGVGVIPILRSWRRRETEGAKADLPAVAAEPTGAAHRDRGLELAQSGRLMQALPHLRHGLRTRPTDPEARYLLGLAMAKAGRPVEALGHFEYAIRLDVRYLVILLKDPEAAEFRKRPDVYGFLKRKAKRFKEQAYRGYA